MSDQLTFLDGPIEFPEEPPVHDHHGPTPEATIREAFLRFHRENPHIYDEIVKLARRARGAGSQKIGIGMVFEVMRWRHTIGSSGDDFKLNNNYRSYYARMVMAREYDLRDIFELRGLHGAGLKPEDLR